LLVILYQQTLFKVYLNCSGTSRVPLCQLRLWEISDWQALRKCLFALNVTVTCEVNDYQDFYSPFGCILLRDARVLCASIEVTEISEKRYVKQVLMALVLALTMKAKSLTLALNSGICPC